MPSFLERVMAAVDTFRTYGQEKTLSQDALRNHYALLGAFYSGVWLDDPRWKVNRDLYVGSRQIITHTGAIVDCYEQLIYAGPLPTPAKGKPLADANSAIPIVPETGDEAANEALLRAFYTGFDIAKWQQSMGLIPRMAAVFGDVFVVLADDYERGVILPQLINPWDVPTDGLELDNAGNIKALAIERDIDIQASTAFGRNVKAEKYRYRKEITTTEILYYRDDKPFDYGGGSVQENPYGFVPAVLYRHEIKEIQERGLAAYERSLFQMLEIDSLFSGALDYQRKKFRMPIGVIGSAVRAGRTLTVPRPLQTEAARRAAAEQQEFLPLSEGGQFISVEFDIGKTLEMLQFMNDAFIAEHPEAKYAQLLGELKVATAPGVRMTLAPIIAKVNGVARGHDVQMIKQWQMFTTMMGYRVNSGDIPEEIVSARPDRYDAFRPFDLESYGQGVLDASIKERDPFPESQSEKAQWLAIAADLPAWALRELGISEEDIATQEAEKREAREAQLAAFSVAGVGSEEEEQGEGEGQPQPRQQGGVNA